MIKLFGSYTSPFVRHCRIALLQTRTDFEFIETDYAQSAQHSPAMRVPFLQDDSITLHDSASILKYIRAKSGEDFCQDLSEFELFCLINTALDSTINLFLLEKSGVNIAANDYLKRQQHRVEACLATFEQAAQAGLAWNDAGIRLACFIDWALYRHRLSFDTCPALLSWLEHARQQTEFQLTALPG